MALYEIGQKLAGYNAVSNPAQHFTIMRWNICWLNDQEYKFNLWCQLFYIIYLYYVITNICHIR